MDYPKKIKKAITLWYSKDIIIKLHFCGPQCKYLISGNINKDMDVHEYGLNKGMRKKKNITK